MTSTPAATILVVDDDAAIRTVIRQALTRAGHMVRTTDTIAGLWRLIDEGVGDIVITDVILPDANGLDVVPLLLDRRPGMKIIIISAQNTLSTAVRATEQGAFEYLPKPFDINELTRAVASALEADLPETTRKQTKDDSNDALPLIGRSAAMQEIYRTMARVVPTDLTVMILGESGTGKELVARALHDLGARKTAPFVAINMAAIPRELIESELFGHERGSFTGAATRATGRFEQAQGGTLFLDEIGDMPMDAQTRLLRVLQSGEFSTIGGTKLLRADVRIIAATNKDLRRSIENGLFREDLFYRLNVVPLRLPPLRARVDDIAELARHFLQRAAAEGLPLKQLDAEAVLWMQRYAWPGNVRELENLMRRLAALTRGEYIFASAVEEGLRDGQPLRTSLVSDSVDSLSGAVETHIARYFAVFGNDLPPDGLYERILAEIERPLLLLTLAATQGNQIQAAKLLGINRNTLRKKLTLRDVNPGALRQR